MKKFFKWLGIVLGGLLGLVFLILVGLSLSAGARLNRSYNIPTDNITIPTDTESIAAGKHWVEALCIGCHHADLSGGPFLEAPFGYIDAANLTPGKGGAGSKFTDADWVRALRHGVDEAGHPLIVMPAQEFWHFSDQDLGEIVAYLKTLPPIDNETREPQFNFLGKALLAAGMFGSDIIPAEVIQHSQRPTAPLAGVTVEYGDYLVNVSGCRSCHGKQLSGGKSADPSAIAAPNLTPGGELVAWEEADFVKALREGVAKSGHQLDPLQMPWEHYRYFSDDELKAIWVYLQSLPALPITIP
ncbi:MAG: c-type cytochrome [Anaerolineales bacterium]|nr:c-type cytochrome [Anaerolineales bacterium]